MTQLNSVWGAWWWMYMQSSSLCIWGKMTDVLIQGEHQASGGLPASPRGSTASSAVAITGQASDVLVNSRPGLCSLWAGTWSFCGSHGLFPQATGPLHVPYFLSFAIQFSHWFLNFGANTKFGKIHLRISQVVWNCNTGCTKKELICSTLLGYAANNTWRKDGKEMTDGDNSPIFQMGNQYIYTQS